MEAELQSFVLTRFLTWSAIVSRLSGLFLFAPFFGGRLIPGAIKPLAVLALSFVTLPVVPDVIPIQLPVYVIVLMNVMNFTFGLAAGMVASVLFYGLQFAGDTYGYQLGLAAASIFDPLTEVENVIMGQLIYYIGLFIFVAIKGPMYLLMAIQNSFQSIPPLMLTMDGSFNLRFSEIMGKTLELGIQIGIPMIVFMLLVTFVLGIMSKLLPQLNVFVVGMPLKMLVGMLILIGLLPVWADMVFHFSKELVPWLEEIWNTFR